MVMLKARDLYSVKSIAIVVVLLLLINLRSRGRSARPFTVVNDLRASADQEFRIKQGVLQEKLSETGHRLKQLQESVASASEAANTGKMVITPEQMAEINKFRAEHIQIRNELRNVQHALSKDIESLGTKLKVINIALIPSIVVLLAIILGMIRMRRAATGQVD